MSWLDELEYTFLYACPEGHETTITTGTQPARDSTLPCEECGGVASYKMLLPMVLNSRTAVEGEQNGRTFVEYRDGKGNVRRISKTKLEYLRTGKNTDSVLSDSYKKHLARAQVSSAQKTALKE